MLSTDRQRGKQTGKQTGKQRGKQTGKQVFGGYMSRGDILLTNERMENSIPYISLNSCRDTNTHCLPKYTQLVYLFVCLRCAPHLILGDPRLLLAVPLIIVQTVSTAVKDVQVVDRHLTHKHTNTVINTQSERVTFTPINNCNDVN